MTISPALRDQIDDAARQFGDVLVTLDLSARDAMSDPLIDHRVARDRFSATLWDRIKRAVSLTAYEELVPIIDQLRRVSTPVEAGWHREVKRATLQVLQEAGGTLACARACMALTVEQQARVIVDVDAVSHFVRAFGDDPRPPPLSNLLSGQPLRDIVYESAARNLIDAARAGARAHELPLDDLPTEWREAWHDDGNGN